MRLLFVLFALFVLCAPCFARGDTNPNKAAAMAPNVDISTYRRCYSSTEKLKLNLQAFNVPSVKLTAYRLDIAAAVPNSAVMDDFSKTEKKLNLSRMSVAARWTVAVKTYPNQWASIAARVPKFKPGAYLIVASAGGAEKRTWLAVTDSSLLVKRSPLEVLVFATNIVSGKPLAGITLYIEDRGGKITTCVTDSDGIVRLPIAESRARRTFRKNDRTC